MTGEQPAISLPPTGPCTRSQRTNIQKGIDVKEFVIGVNNIVLYVALAVIWIATVVMIFVQGFWSGAGVFITGTLTWCIISGFWFVQSATYEELKKLNAK
jgi:hypothetical protein